MEAFFRLDDLALELRLLRSELGHPLFQTFSLSLERGKLGFRISKMCGERFQLLVHLRFLEAETLTALRMIAALHGAGDVGEIAFQGHHFCRADAEAAGDVKILNDQNVAED